MADVTPSNPTIKPPSSTTAFHRSTTTLPRFNLPITTPKRHRTLHITTNVLSKPTTVQTPQPEIYVSRYADDQPRKGSDVLVKAWEHEGVTGVFAYPGGASIEIHQALTRSHIIRNVLPHHEQGGVFAAEGYARASRKPVPRRMIGTDAFQEAPIVEVTRSITKHKYLVLDVNDIPRVVKEAFYLARTGYPPPILIDVPKDIQQQLVIVWLVSEAKKHVLYAGGGCLDASEELRRFMELTGIPVTNTLMGLGTFPASDDLLLRMLGMHGTVYANYVVDKSDLLLAFEVLDELTGGDVIISRLGAMGFRLPATIGAAVARPDAVVVDIYGDGSFMMNVQELATIHVENLPVKILLLNNQHLGMVFAEACDILAARVTKKADLRAAIQKMLDTPGPYLLDVIVPHQEHVLPMIPAGGGFMDVITEGDGRTQY
ncbi:acetolactate synthase [Tanacetum coccineum]